jgi:hypothetical protein
MNNIPRRFAIIVAGTAVALAGLAGPALASDETGPVQKPPGCAAKCGDSGHPNAGRGNGSETAPGSKVDLDPGNSTGHNNGGD